MEEAVIAHVAKAPGGRTCWRTSQRKSSPTGVSRDDAVMEQARTHSDEQMMRGRYPEVLEKLVIDSMNDNEKLATEVLEREETMSAFARLVLALARERQSETATSG